VCSCELVEVSPRDGVDDAVLLMRERAVRRIPVVDGSDPLGIVTMADRGAPLWATKNAASVLSRWPGTSQRPMDRHLPSS